jgi:putative ABC transport system permease protein
MSNSKYKQLFNLTIKSIFRRRLRSILTSLSVVIGIASVIALVLLSDGLLNTVMDQFDSMGSNSIFVFAGNFQGNPFESGGISKENQLTVKDADNLEKISDVEIVYGMNFFNGIINYKTENEFANIVTLPVEKMDSALDYFNVSIAEGKNFNGREGNYAIIGDYTAKKLFGREIKVGNKIEINGVEFKVIGILNVVGNTDDDNTIYITQKAGDQIGNFNGTINYMVLKLRPTANSTLATNRIKKQLNRTRSEDSYLLITADDFLELIKRVITLLKIVLITIAGISIVVGSLGIINSVYTSVLERTKEIGVLKSIGAKISDITFIFVLESVILSLFGGIIGFGLGYGISRFVQFYAASAGFDMFTIIVTKEIILLALGLSFLVGVVAGLFPARSAAKLNPVNALRGSM